MPFSIGRFPDPPLPVSQILPLKHHSISFRILAPKLGQRFATTTRRQRTRNRLSRIMQQQEAISRKKKQTTWASRFLPTPWLVFYCCPFLLGGIYLGGLVLSHSTQFPILTSVMAIASLTTGALLWFVHFFGSEFELALGSTWRLRLVLYSTRSIASRSTDTPTVGSLSASVDYLCCMATRP